MREFLVYRYKGKLKITEGTFDGNVFRKKDNPKKYHSKICPFPLVIWYGKCWCYERDLAKAVQMVKDHFVKYADDMEKRNEKLQANMDEWRKTGGGEQMAKMRTGDTATVKDGCSKLEAGTRVLILHYSEATGEYWCRSFIGRTCYWIKAELLEVSL